MSWRVSGGTLVRCDLVLLSCVMCVEATDRCSGFTHGFCATILEGCGALMDSRPSRVWGNSGWW